MGRPAATRESELAPTPAAAPRPLSPVVLVGLVTLLATQCLRVLFPLAYNLGERTSFTSAGIFALALSLTPIVAPLVIRPLGLRRALVVTVAGLSMARLAIQLVHPVPLWLASVAVVLGLLALTTALVSIRGGRLLVAGMVLGLTVDTALTGAYWTWDYAWQDGVVPVALTIVAAGAGAVMAFRTAIEGRSQSRRAFGLVAVGPFLFLQLLFFQNPAFAASSTGVPLPLAVMAVLAGDALALWYLAFPDRDSQLGLWVGRVGLVVITLLLSYLAAGMLVFILTAQGLAALLLARALLPRGGEAGWRPFLALGLGTFTFILLTLLYYLHYDSPLPFPNSVLPVAAALILAFAAPARLAEWEPVLPRAFALSMFALLVLPATTIHWGSDPAPAVAAGSTFRLVDYNIHSGVSPTGQLNPEAIARVIETERPDVVVLNEVNRGWAIAGRIDLAEWLSQRLDLEYVYSPAADGQFGNAVMSRYPITRVERVTLPKAGGPMLRNGTLATLDLGNGRVADVIAVHLDHRDEGQETRLTQIGVLLDFWNQRPVTVIAGDMNARPVSDEIAALTAAGLVSAQDEAGDPSLETYPSVDPDRRIDYVFGSNGITFSNFRIPQTTASDHLPLSVTVRVG